MLPSAAVPMASMLCASLRWLVSWYGSFSGQMPRPVYDETECAPCPAESRRAYRIEVDAKGIGHVIREAQ